MSISRRFTSCFAHVDRLAALCRYLWWATFCITAIIVFPVLAVLVAVAIVYRRSRQTADSGFSHGTARFADINDLIRADCLFHKGGLLMGFATRLEPLKRLTEFRYLLSWPLRRSGELSALMSLKTPRPVPMRVTLPDHIPHAAIYGASGSGKSTCYSAPMLQHCGDSMVVLDPKGELARNFSEHRKRHWKQPVYIIDPFNVTGLESHQLNPLDWVRGNESMIVDEARRMANAIVVRGENETEPFFNDAATALITGTLGFLMSEHVKAEEANLNRLRDLISNPEFFNQMLKIMEQSDACGGLLRRLVGEIGQHEGKTRASIFGVANSHLSFLDSLAIVACLDKSTFDPNELVCQTATVFLCLPVDRIKEMASFQRVILSTIINLVFAAGEDSKRRVRLLLDEAATLGPMDSLYNSVQFGRSFGLRLTFLFQSISQTERCFPGSQSQDFKATVAGIHCGCGDLESAKEVSEWMGEFTTCTRSASQGASWGGSLSQGTTDQTHGQNWGGNDSSSFNESARSLLKPEEILQMSKHLAIALIPNVPPILLEKVPYFAKPKSSLIRQFARRTRNGFIVTASVALLVTIGWVASVGTSDPLVAQALVIISRIQHGDFSQF